MSDCRHTPGPWFSLPLTEDENNAVVYRLQKNQYGQTIAACEINMNQPGEVNANAQLIAAAPDLLEACEEALSKMNEYSMLQEDNFLSRAIDKAKGK